MIRLYHHPADDLAALQETLKLFPANMTSFAKDTAVELVPDDRLTRGHCLAVIDGDCKMEP